MVCHVGAHTVFSAWYKSPAASRKGTRRKRIMKAKKNLNRLLSILLYSIMLVGLLTTTVFAEGITTIDVSNSEELSDAINLINANTDTNNEYIINLTDDIETSGFAAQSPCEVTILGTGYFNSWTIRFYHDRKRSTVKSGL